MGEWMDNTILWPLFISVPFISGWPEGDIERLGACVQWSPFMVGIISISSGTQIRDQKLAGQCLAYWPTRAQNDLENILFI